MTMEPTFFPSAASFRAWLDRHHDTERELLVALYKKKTGRGMTYPEALAEALCFGWIDGVRKRVDGEAYTIRFTPRKAGSVWSAVNIRLAEKLIAGGVMRPPGLRAFGGPDGRKTRQYSYERETMKLDAGLEAVLRADRKAAAFFDAQPAGYRKLVTFWVMSAKREETRARRLGRVIECSGRGERVGLLSPNG